jgi:hypothetical protein
VKLAVLLILATVGGILSLRLPLVRVKLEIYDVQDFVPCSGDWGHSVGDDAFIHRVKAAVAAQEWQRKTQWSIQCQNGLLIVRAPSHVQREVEVYLAGVRAQ